MNSQKYRTGKIVPFFVGGDTNKGETLLKSVLEFDIQVWATMIKPGSVKD